MGNLLAPIGLRMKLTDGSITRPLLAELLRGLVVLLFLLLVPLLYVAIFRARKKHALAIGELDLFLLNLVLIHQESLRERAQGGQGQILLGHKLSLVLGL